MAQTVIGRGMAISRTVKGALLAMAVLAVVSLLALTWYSRTVSFEEEFQLSDGRKILVRRSEHLKKACEGLACDWSLDRTTIRLPEGPPWEFANLMPLLLDLDADGHPVIVASPMTCGDYVRMNRPVPPYLQFELDSTNTWKRVEPARQFHGREANFLIAPDWRRGESAVVPLSEKQKRNSSPGLIPMSKRINLDLTGLC